MTTGFSKKRIDVTFSLGQGTFGTSGFKTVKCSGYRVQCDIARSGGVSKGELNLRIYGLDVSTMNQLARVGRVPTGQTQNQIIVAAGDTDPLPNVYKGSIFMGWADFTAAPDVAFVVGAQAGWWETVYGGTPSSYHGSVDVAQIMADLVAKMNAENGTGYTVENNSNLSFTLNDQYLSGSYFAQAQTAAFNAGINMELDNDVLAIWPMGGARVKSTTLNANTPIVSIDTGEYGYPKYNATGITVRCAFNPAIKVGGLIYVKSLLQPATQTWIVNTIAHNLDSEIPNGNWFSTMECSAPGRLVIP